MPLNAKQKEAVETIQGPLLVLAGPGTGKTHLLSARVENILNVTDTNPENILCLTFTENGASNMRERLASTIKDEARKIEIHTYHSFGSDLLNSYKNYAESFDRNLETPISDVKQYKIVKEIQDELKASDILKTAKIKDLIDTISSAKGARFTGDELIFIADKNEKLSEKINKDVQEVFVNAPKGARFEKAVNEVYLPLLEVFVKYISKENILREVEPISNVLARTLKDVIGAEREQEKPSTKPLTSWRNKNFEKDDEGNFRLKDRVSNKKLRSFGNVMNKYSEHLEKEGLFDFDDMIQQAITVLSKDEGFRKTCQERFQYILLDEFQDTNPSQAEIIRLLTDYEEPNVMAVGDDDQAIFEFQGADASNLLNFQSFYNAKVVNLEENYRSKQEILDFSRKIADQITDSFSKKRGVSKNLKAFRGTGGKIAQHEFLTADQEYQFVADEIEKLIENGVEQKEIAVIAPKHKFILPLIPFLKESEKINIAYEKRDNIFEDTRISEIIRMAKFVFGLSQGKDVSSKLLEILSFPFWDIPADLAVQTVYYSKNSSKTPLDYLSGSENEKLKELAKFLAKLAMLSFDSSLELILDCIVGTVPVDDYRSPFLEFYSKELGDYDNFELYENLAILKEALRGYSSERNLKLKDFVEMVEDYDAAGFGLTNTSPYRDSEDAIQILTSHKSKGLEYKYVFLVATDNLNWGPAKGNNNEMTLPKNLEHIRHTGATDDERLRLLFVAITRAKDAVILTSSLKNFAGKSPARLTYLQEYTDEKKNLISPFVPPEGEYKVLCHYEDLQQLRKVVDLRKTWRSAYVKQTPELRPILLKRMERYRLSATDLTSFVDITYAGPMKFYEKRILLCPQEPADSSMLLGTFVHKVFEKVTKEHVSDEEAIEFFREELKNTFLTDKEQKDLSEKGEASLKVALVKFGHLLRDERAKAETDFGPENIYIKNTPALGKVDLMIVDKNEKTIEIFDYKTGKYKDGNWGSDVGLLKYYLQLWFYKLLLNNSKNYKDFEVIKGHILFVSPDFDGKVYDKELDFRTDKVMDGLEIQKLVEAVYMFVSSLKFLDFEELCVEESKENGAKEMKDFINLLLEKYSEIN
ncbi:ATP-dependent helicase [Candidatus Saccharibacteria bacterium]|nr:ATP-dependent helicase [Candidatus Saccharibacteria bacterium]